jgi:hypothetical protein
MHFDDAENGRTPVVCSNAGLAGKAPIEDERRYISMGVHLYDLGVWRFR